MQLIWLSNTGKLFWMPLLTFYDFIGVSQNVTILPAVQITSLSLLRRCVSTSVSTVEILLINLRDVQSSLKLKRIIKSNEIWWIAFAVKLTSLVISKTLKSQLNSKRKQRQMARDKEQERRWGREERKRERGLNGWRDGCTNKWINVSSVDKAAKCEDIERDGENK